MSILDFLKGVLATFISNFPKFYERLYKKIVPEIKEQVSVITKVVNGIKQFVDSPLADVLTQIIPGGVDDVMKDWLRKNLPAILTNLGYLENGIIKLSDDSKAKGGQLVALSSVLTSEITEMPLSQAAITAQVVYQAEQ